MKMNASIIVITLCTLRGSRSCLEFISSKPSFIDYPLRASDADHPHARLFATRHRRECDNFHPGLNSTARLPPARVRRLAVRSLRQRARSDKTVRKAFAASRVMIGDFPLRGHRGAIFTSKRPVFNVAVPTFSVAREHPTPNGTNRGRSV